MNLIPYDELNVPSGVKTEAQYISYFSMRINQNIIVHNNAIKNGKSLPDNWLRLHATCSHYLGVAFRNAKQGIYTHGNPQWKASADNITGNGLIIHSWILERRAANNGNKNEGTDASYVLAHENYFNSSLDNPYPDWFGLLLQEAKDACYKGRYWDGR